MITPQLSRHHRAPVAKMAQWFRNALTESEPQPSLEQIADLTRKFQVLLNQADNDQKTGSARSAGASPPSLLELKDFDPKRLLSDKLFDVARAGKALLLQLDLLEKYAVNYEWVGLTRSVTIEDIRDVLLQIGSLAVDDAGPIPAARGQPPKAWHDVARRLSPLISELLKGIGYEEKDTNLKDPSSATACICAAALKWAYHEEITPEGFASAMRDRDRSKRQFSGTEFDEIFSSS